MATLLDGHRPVKVIGVGDRSHQFPLRFTILFGGHLAFAITRVLRHLFSVTEMSCSFNMTKYMDVLSNPLFFDSIPVPTSAPLK